MANKSKVLALHSLGTDLHLWDGVVANWSLDIPFMAIDLPGHGGRISEGFSIEKAADTVIEWLEKEGPAFLLGISMGGPISLTVSDKRPDLVSGLILMNTFAYQGDAGPSRVEAVAKSIDGVGFHDYAASYASSVVYQKDNHRAIDYITNAILQLGAEGYVQAASSVFTADVRKAASAVDKPTLVVAAVEDNRVPEALSRELARLIPHASFVTTPASGHLSPLDNPAEVTGVVEGFLKAASR